VVEFSGSGRIVIVTSISRDTSAGKKDLGHHARPARRFTTTRATRKAPSLEWGFAEFAIHYDGRGISCKCELVTNGFVAAFDVANGKRSSGSGTRFRD